jgi:signal transduction histidine kinase
MMITPQATTRGIAFVAEPCPPSVVALADASKVEQVLLNLLSNAVKFTARGGRVVLRCAADDGVVVAEVSDTGVGIPADRLAEVFEPFVQLDRSLENPREGVGLGLAISRDLARGMRGDLTVESAVGVGSTFTLTLPRAPKLPVNE